MIALLSSVPLESDLILSHMKKRRFFSIAGKPVYTGTLSGEKVLLMNTGIGKVNASHSASCIIEKFPVKKIINFGVGGAYPGSGLALCDLAVASKEIYGDEGVVDSGGWSSLKKIGIPLVREGGKKYFNEYPVSLPPIQKKSGKVRDIASVKIRSGPFLTLSTVTGTRRRAGVLEKRFRTICENMEGAAIAQICTMYKIPMHEIRGISNIAGVRDRKKWDLEGSSENCQMAVMGLIGCAE